MSEKPSKPPKKQKDPNKVFLEKCKLYLSSSNSRQTTYAYFNVIPNTIILSNSTSPPAGKTEIVHGDRLMNQVSSELGLHVITFKDTDFYNEIVLKFKIPVTREIYWIQLNKVISTLINKADIQVDTFGAMWIASDNKAIGDFVPDIHVVASMLSIYNEFKSAGSEQHQNDFTHLRYVMEAEPQRLGKLFMLDLNITDFTKRSQMLEYATNRIRFPVVDGISTVDTKEFLKKIVTQKIDFEHELYLWAEDNHSISMVSLYNDASVEIRSIRPHLNVVPMLNNFEAEVVNYLEDFKASQHI